LRASRATRRTKENRDVGGVGPDFVDHILKKNIYIYIYKLLCVYIGVYMYIYIYVYVSVYVYVYMYIYICRYVCILLLVTCRNFPKHRRTMAL
jgi:hypothetical protein